MSQTVLVIDDSVEIHYLLEARLRPERLELRYALGAEEGLSAARALQPDLILLDVSMPERSGFEVCRLLKEDPRTAALPIIFLSGSTDVVNKVLGFELGAVDYVTKPFDPAELRARVRSALRMKRYQDMLAARAQLDGLTGLWNRAYFDRRVVEEIAAVQRYGRRLCLVMLDIDHFKALNDRHGHPFGDQVLQGVGECLAAAVRTADAACRYGGEEFCLILGETDSQGGLVLAQRVRERFGELNLWCAGQVVPVTASFGVASSDQFQEAAELSARQLIAAADAAMYLAKTGGRDQVCVGVPTR